MAWQLWVSCWYTVVMRGAGRLDASLVVAVAAVDDRTGLAEMVGASLIEEY